MDFKLNVDRDEIRILQLTDMQVIDSSQQRSPTRLCEAEYLKWLPETVEDNIYSHIRYLVEKTQPDLIIITGDIIYGEFDDSGRVFDEFCDFMDSFGIPWAPVFGNHDNESMRGIDWQCERFASSKCSFFKKGSVFGNSNYSIGIYSNGKLIRNIFMTDSNGCGKLNIPSGFKEDQLDWIRSEAKELCGIPSFMCFHIPTQDFNDAAIIAGYQEKEDARDSFFSYEIGKTVSAREGMGEFGKKTECMPPRNDRLLPFFKECNIDGLFAGHFHRISTSIVNEGVRFTFGYKTGLYDYHDPEAMGGTLITLKGKDFDIQHIQYPL